MVQLLEEMITTDQLDRENIDLSLLHPSGVERSRGTSMGWRARYMNIDSLDLPIQSTCSMMNPVDERNRQRIAIHN